LYERASTLRSSYIACHVSHIAESSVTSTWNPFWLSLWEVSFRTSDSYDILSNSWTVSDTFSVKGQIIYVLG
jgi:hypothetical protein